MKPFALLILWLTFLELDTDLDAVMFLILNSWYFSSGFFFYFESDIWWHRRNINLQSPKCSVFILSFPDISMVI